MGGSPGRKARRKAQKEFSYEQYAKRKMAEGKRTRVAECRVKMKLHWKKKVADLVPRWIRIIALFIPPKWYHTKLCGRLFLKLDTRLDRAANVYKIQFVNKPFRKWLNIRGIVIAKWSYRWATLMVPLWWARKRVMTFGTFTSVRLIKHDTFRMVIRSIWTREKDDSEWSF